MPRRHVSATFYSENLGSQWSGLKVAVVTTTLVLAFVAIGTKVALADGPSFDCKQTRGIIERMICDVPQLASADLGLARE